MANTPPEETISYSRGKIGEISILRCAAILSLVMHHVLCIYMADSWGEIVTPVNHYYAKIMHWLIPEANMPLFVFIAGYLMGYQMQNKKYDNLWSFTKKKVHRLLIPYIVLGAIMVLLQPGIPYGWNGMLYGVPNHLWFCLMLFYCYMIFFLVERYAKDWIQTLLAMISLLICMKYGNMWALYRDYHLLGGVEFVGYFYFWFWFGTIVYKHNKVVVSMSGTIVFTVLYMFTHGIVKEIAFIFLLLIVASWIVNARKIPDAAKSIIERFAKYSFGIYVFHHLILWDVTHIDAISKYVLPLYETHCILMPIGMFIVALGLSYILTDLSLRTKIGKYILI